MKVDPTLSVVLMGAGMALVGPAPYASALLWYGGWLALVCHGRAAAVGVSVAMLAMCASTLPKDTSDLTTWLELVLAIGVLVDVALDIYSEKKRAN